MGRSAGGPSYDRLTRHDLRSRSRLPLWPSPSPSSSRSRSSTCASTRGPGVAAGWSPGRTPPTCPNATEWLAPGRPADVERAQPARATRRGRWRSSSSSPPPGSAVSPWATTCTRLALTPSCSSEPTSWPSRCSRSRTTCPSSPSRERSPMPTPTRSTSVSSRPCSSTRRWGRCRHRAVERQRCCASSGASSTAACCCSTPPPPCPWWPRTRSLRTAWPTGWSRTCGSATASSPRSSESTATARAPSRCAFPASVLRRWWRSTTARTPRTSRSCTTPRTSPALEVERVNAERDHGRRLGSELLAAMLERRIEPASAVQRLEEHGIVAETAVLMAFRPTRTGRAIATCITSWPSSACPTSSYGATSAASRPFPTPTKRAAALRSAVGPDGGPRDQRSAAPARPSAGRGTRGSLGADRRAHAGPAVRALRRGHPAVLPAHPRGGRHRGTSACSGRSSPTTRSTPRS